MDDRSRTHEQLIDEITQLGRLVAELRSSEASLREEQDPLRFLKHSIDGAPDGAFCVKADGRFLYFNDAACSTLGYSRDELLSMTLRDIDPYFSADAWPQRWDLTRLGGSRIFESRLRAKDGRLIPVEIKSVYLEFNGQGYACAFARDTSTRQQTQRKATESEMRLRAMIESQPECVSLKDREGRFLDINPAGLALVEANSPDEVLGKSIDTFVAPEWLDSFKEFGTKVFRGEISTLEFEIIGLKGTRRWVEARATPLRDGQGNIVSMLGVTRDITERKQNETTLRENEQRYRELFENANDPIFTIDLAGDLTSVNRMAERMSGFKREQLLGMNLSRFLSPEHYAVSRKMLDGRIAGEDLPNFYEMEFIARDGNRIPIEVNPSLIYREGRPAGLQVVAREVTQRKRLEEQLQQSQKMEAIGRLAGGVAHDFNNLLTAILGYSDLLLSEIGENSQMQSDIEAIKRAADRAAMLTRQLLAFSRRQILAPQILNLNEVVANVEKMLRRVIGEDIELVITRGEDLRLVKADPGQVEQILLNLAINSRDAMPDGGRLHIETANLELTPSEALEYGIAAQVGYVMLAVSDTGIGIDEEVQPHIFEPFFTTKEQGKGTGLGLSTVYGIVRQSGGHITVRSESGKGTTFRIYMPQIEELTIPEEPVRHAPAGTQRQETILVVEDEEVVRNLVRNLLRTFGYNVLEARQGEEALQILQRQPNGVDLVITDIVMPVMGGRQLGEHLASLNPDIRILYMSGYTDVAVVRQGTLGSDVAFLQKPFTPDLLARKVREVLDA